jgi:DNA replication licensing factor MCM4
MQLARDPNIYHKLVASFAPSIYEMDDVKKGLLCQLFGGRNSGGSGSEGAGSGRFRGDLNVRLMGDPGVSKSQLLQYVHKIAPRGIYTSGKGSSAVGLTAYVTKDPETKDIVLESGALVLSDKGICCIDEFDKMSDSTRAILHEAMEQQTISVAKAGIICSLNARTSILAAANPINSRYNPEQSVVENMNLPPTLLSRFDLIYLLLDQPNMASDKKLAKHIVSLYYEHPPQAAATVLSIEEFAEYVSYAREHCHPALSDEAKSALIDGYVSMRRMSTSKNTISATPRQLESIVRLSEAHAKMRLSGVVEVMDVEEAMRLLRVATQSAATDPRTGKIDMDLIQTGRSASSRVRVATLVAVC